ncbi:hypothetical protein F2P81_001872 [Scophthalmus maximus]|uniref:Centrosomal protein of 72 kDa-like n=1 Tax=Scophthalmus maximus TaxID=52904 RepID=A0A6A4THB7_SCOMX|nr:hypothetical protein F2P81_001872 [Scophthalmus maximus]
MDEVNVLYELTALRELDLRLNPLTKSYPNYRCHLLHDMPNLRRLDSCSVRDIERKAAVMQVSFDLLPHPKSSCLNPDEEERGSDQRLALVDRLTKRFSLPTDIDDIVLNFEVMNHGGQSETISDSVNKEAEDKTECKVPHMKGPSHKKSSPSSKVTERPKVSFGPYVEKHRPVPGKQNDFPKQTRHAAKGHFTPNPDQSQRHSSSFINIRPPSPHRPGLNISDPSNPILHPPRLTYSSFNKTEGGSSLLQQAEKKKKGSYRKPLELLLNLVDKHWKGERSLHHNNNFLPQAVQILSMMENDISSREAEVRTLRREADAQSFQAATREEEHTTEVRHLSAQLEEARSAVGKLNQQVRIVLEENVALQKQLIKLEGQYLKSMMKSSPITQIKEAKRIWQRSEKVQLT